MWAFTGAFVAAAVTLTGLLFSRVQAERTERRLAFDAEQARRHAERTERRLAFDAEQARRHAEQTERRLVLDTTVEGLKLLMMPGGEKGYAPGAAVAGAIATLVHLHHPVIAMRALGAAWNDDAVDVPSATWLLSEIFGSKDEQAKLEAAAMLDAHAHELCDEREGKFSWPQTIEFSWPRADFAARLRVHHAILTILTSKSREWWRKGATQGWAAGLLYQALADDEKSIRAHAGFELRDMLEDIQLGEIMSNDGWIDVSAVRSAAHRAPKEPHRINVLLRSEARLKCWIAHPDKHPHEWPDPY